MREYVRDGDGDVWVIEGGQLRHHRWPDGNPGNRSWTVGREEAEDSYGPLTPCDADGEPLPAALPDEVRSLVADAFDGLAEQMSAFPPFSWDQSIPDGMRSQMAGWVGEWASSMAAGMRS